MLIEFFLLANIQIIGMTATIGNLSEISVFLNADVYRHGFGPLDLVEYIKCGSDLVKINANANSPEETFTFERKIDFKVIFTIKYFI